MVIGLVLPRLSGMGSSCGKHSCFQQSDRIFMGSLSQDITCKLQLFLGMQHKFKLVCCRLEIDEIITLHIGENMPYSLLPLDVVQGEI